MKPLEYIATNYGLVALRKLYFPIRRQPDTQGGDYPQQGEVNVSEGPLSMLGTPVVSRLTLKSQDESVSLDIDTAIIAVSRTKNVVRNEVAGRNGTVKELVSASDYYLTIKGGLFESDPYTYPQQLMATFNTLMNLNEPLKVESDYLQLFDIYEIVVTRHKAPQRRGVQNAQLFEITALEDKPLELIIEEEEQDENA